MKEQGFEVLMMSADGPEIKDLLDSENCEHITLPLTRRISPVVDLFAIIKLFSILVKYKPDIVHSHTPKAGMVSMVAAYLARVPIRIHTIAGLPLQSATGIKLTILKWIERLTNYCATQVWPNSFSLQEYMINNNLVNKNKLRIIGNGSSNGIDLNEFNPDTLESQLLDSIKAKIEYKSESKYLLFVGRVVRDKGVDELLIAFKQLRKLRKDLKLLIVGPFENKHKPISNEGLNILESNDSIICTGFSRYVKYYMHLADLFVFPSHREGFPNVLLQAGAMCCPIVCSKIEGNTDIIRHGETGLLHERANADDLFVQIQSALDNPSEMKSLAETLKFEINHKFNRSVIHDKILEAYLDLMKQNQISIKAV